MLLIFTDAVRLFERVRREDMLRARAVFDHVEQHGVALFRHERDLLRNGGEPRLVVPANGQAVKADEGNVLRDALSGIVLR